MTLYQFFLWVEVISFLLIPTAVVLSNLTKKEKTKDFLHKLAIGSVVICLGFFVVGVFFLGVLNR